MLSDGLTKGAVEREMLQLAMEGYQKFAHEFKVWSTKIAKPTQRLIEQAAAQAVHGA